MATGNQNMVERSYKSVFVGNIPYDASEESLRELFSQVGPVASVRLVFDRETGKPKGYGFCEFLDKETAMSAQRNLNGIEFHGRQLRVDAAVGERSKEELQQLRTTFTDKEDESPYGPEQDPEKAPHEVTRMVMQLPPEQMFELLKQVKVCIETNVSEARNMLLQNPQLAFAFLQVLICVRHLDLQDALNIISLQPVATMPQTTEVPVTHPTGKVPLLPTTFLPQPVGMVPDNVRNLEATQTAIPANQAPELPVTQPVRAPLLGTVASPYGAQFQTTVPPGWPISRPQPTIQAVPPAMDPEKSALIAQLMQLTDEQISALPPDQRQTVTLLRQQFRGVAHM